jgi:acyl dehydratase
MTMQRYWDDISSGDSIGTLAFPITVARLVMVSGANRDFNAIHHNTEFARASGAPEMYANTMFLQGMWERLVRNYIGNAGRIIKLTGFRMRTFNCPGDTVIVSGHVTEKWLEGEMGLVRIELRSDNKSGLTVGPGAMIASLPRSPNPRQNSQVSPGA